MPKSPKRGKRVYRVSFLIEADEDTVEYLRTRKSAGCSPITDLEIRRLTALSGQKRGKVC